MLGKYGKCVKQCCSVNNIYNSFVACFLCKASVVVLYMWNAGDVECG